MAGDAVGWLMERTGRAGRPAYTAMYRDLRGRKRSAGTFTSERQANRAWQSAEAALASGRVADPRRSQQTLRAYVDHEWFPNHVIEATTRESYRYILDRYLLPALGDLRMADVLPSEVRQWIARLQDPLGVNPPTIVKCKIVLDAIFTTAMNDQVVVLHPGKGAKTPPVATRPRRIITADQSARIRAALPDDTMRLLVETDVESGLRWGELTELRVKDLDLTTGVVTVTRAVVQLTMKNRPDGRRFLVKDYPKDREWRRLQLADHLLAKLRTHITDNRLSHDQLLFVMPQASGPRRYRIPDVLPDPETLGWTEPNAKGRRYRHGTPTAYGMARCRCRHCKDAVAAYRATRRDGGKDHPRVPRTVDTDGHISREWFRNTVWIPALQTANLGFHVTPHGLRHAHASLAGRRRSRPPSRQGTPRLRLHHHHGEVLAHPAHRGPGGTRCTGSGSTPPAVGRHHIGRP